MPVNTQSARPSSRSSLPNVVVGDIASTPSCLPTLRMLTPVRPRLSATLAAASMMRGVRDDRRPMGPHADLVAARVKRVVKKPAGVTHDDAAAVLFGGTTALFYLRDKAGVKPGQSVLVNGASGAVGTNAVSSPSTSGPASPASRARNAALVSDLGAEHVIDYTRTPLEEVGERFDVVLDTVGSVTPASGKRLLRPGGVLLLAVADLWQTVTAHGQVKAGPAPERAEDAGLLLRLVAEGTLRVVIDHAYDLDDIAAAHERVDTGHKVGSIVVHP